MHRASTTLFLCLLALTTSYGYSQQPVGTQPPQQQTTTPPAAATPADSPEATQQPGTAVERTMPSSGLPTARGEDQPSAEGTHRQKLSPGQRNPAQDAPADTDRSEAKDKPNKQDKEKPLPASEVRNPVLWHEPGDIAGKDLYNGQGGEKNYPKPPFAFLEEDKNGTNPKFDARDGNGKKWRVKLGEEARPEVVASRLLWAVGYYANDDYNVPSADVEGLKLSRGNVKGTHITYARFARKPGGQEKVAIWEWKNNPFAGTREFDGLRVMMAVMNNWDLKDINNSVYVDEKTGQQIFLVNDVGATFATNSLETSRSKDKGNLKSFRGSKFITKRDGSTVNFATPAAPTGVLLKSFGMRSAEYFRRSGFEWIGQNIPVEHARWIGELLGRLSVQQLRDAFRAGNFPADQVDIYVDLVHNRILELQDL